MKMLRNGIASQHALLAVGNGLAFVRDMTPVDVHELILEALGRRMTASNIKIQITDEGYAFGIDEFACRPTLVIHAVADVCLKCPTEVIGFRAERGVVVMDGLRLLTGDAMPCSVCLPPGGRMDARVSLPPLYAIKEADVPSAFKCVPNDIRSLADDIASIANRKKRDSLRSFRTSVSSTKQGVKPSIICLRRRHRIQLPCSFQNARLGPCKDSFRRI